MLRRVGKASAPDLLILAIKWKLLSDNRLLFVFSIQSMWHSQRNFSFIICCLQLVKVQAPQWLSLLNYCSLTCIKLRAIKIEKFVSLGTCGYLCKVNLCLNFRILVIIQETSYIVSIIMIVVNVSLPVLG